MAAGKAALRDACTGLESLQKALACRGIACFSSNSLNTPPQETNPERTQLQCRTHQQPEESSSSDSCMPSIDSLLQFKQALCQEHGHIGPEPSVAPRHILLKKAFSSPFFSGSCLTSALFTQPYRHTSSYSTRANPFPSRVDDITATWLTDVLSKSGAIGADSAVQAFSCKQVGKGAGLVSALYAISVTYIGAPGLHAPTQLVAKFAHPSEGPRSFALRNGSYEREAGFYQRFGTRPAGTPATINRHKVPIRTPEIYFCEYNPDPVELCILMQDVSAYELLDQIEGATYDEALGVMQDIGRFHALCWNSPDLEHWSWLPHLSEPRFLAFDPQEYRTAWPRALELFPGLIPEHLHAPLSQLPEAAPRLLERLGSEPRALLHGDLRLDNVYIKRGKAEADKTSPLMAGVTQEPNLLYIDFGDCCVGRGAHDVGYFLSQSVTKEVRREHEKQLLHAYWGALHGSDADDVGDMQERLAGYDFEDFVQDYQYGVLYNFCLAVNMVNLIDGKGGERVRQLAHTAIDRAVQAIEDHNLTELLLEKVS